MLDARMPHGSHLRKRSQISAEEGLSPLLDYP